MVFDDLQGKVYGNDRKICMGFIYYLAFEDPEIEPLMIVYQREPSDHKIWHVRTSLPGNEITGRITIEYVFDMPHDKPSLVLVCETGLKCLRYGVSELSQVYSLYDMAIGAQL